MNRKAKGIVGTTFLALALIGAGCSTKPQVTSQAKEFDPVTAPLCKISNETPNKILLKVVDGPPSTGGSYIIYPQGEKFDAASIYCHSKVEIYSSVSTKPIETVVIDKPGVISLRKQKPGFTVNL
jgi:hypothetical protein